jgi:hypothetical protein
MLLLAFYLFLQVTLTADKVWCNCPDFIQYRLPCKHLLSVAAKKLGNFPLVYQQAVEFNCTMQLKGEYCASVVDITELMQRHSDTDDTPCQEIGYHDTDLPAGSSTDTCIADTGMAADTNTAANIQVTDPTSETQGSMDFEDPETGASAVQVDTIPTRTEVGLKISHIYLNFL